MKHAISVDSLQKKPIFRSHKRNNSQTVPSPLLQLPKTIASERPYQTVNKKLTTRHETIDKWKLKYAEGGTAMRIMRSHNPIQLKKMESYASSILQLPRIRQIHKPAGEVLHQPSSIKNGRIDLNFKHLVEGQSHPQMIVTQKQLSMILKRREISRINRQTVRQLKIHECCKKCETFTAKVEKNSILERLIEQQISRWNNEQEEDLV